MATAVRTSGEPAGRGEFCVPSESMPGEYWSVIWIGGGSQWCGCPGFARRQRCRHTEAVALAVEIEARQPTTPERRAEAATRLEAIERIFS